MFCCCFLPPIAPPMAPAAAPPPAEAPVWVHPRGRATIAARTSSPGSRKGAAPSLIFVSDRAIVVSKLLPSEGASDSMGRLIVSTQMTVDGVIDVGEWYVADGEHDRAGKDQLGQASAVLLGRKTYEGLAAHWSPLGDDWQTSLIRSRSTSRHARFTAPSSGTRRSSKATQPTLSRDSRPSFLPTCCSTLRRVGSVPARGNPRRRTPLLDSSCGLGLRRTPLQGEAQNRLRLLGSEAFDSGVTLLRYAPL